MLLCKLVTTIGTENQTPVLHVEAGGDGEEVCGLVCRVRPPVSPGPALRCPAPGATGRSQLSVTVGPRTRPQPRDVTCRTCIVTLRDKTQDTQMFSWRDNLIVIQCIKNIQALSYLLFMENIYNPNS